MKIFLALLFVFVATTILTASSYFLNNVNASDSVMVNVGGNGSSWSSFTPQSVEINAGETVTWRNPMAVSETTYCNLSKGPKFLSTARCACTTYI